MESFMLGKALVAPPSLAAETGCKAEPQGDHMKLYYSPGACSLASNIIARETNTPVTLVKTDIGKKTYEGGGDFSKINVLGYVPALELDNGTVITEGPAVLQYIADHSGNTSVSPAVGTPARYAMLSWLNFTSTELHGPFGTLWSGAMPDAAKDLARTKLAARFKHLDNHLATNDYLVGKDFTLPDAYAFAVLGWAPMLKMDLSAYPNVLAYIARISARPTVQAALKSEGLI
jgi:glutathione S-transferase